MIPPPLSLSLSLYHAQPGGCAALTGTGLQVGQQILQVSGTNLSGLKHKEVVMTIKSAFEGPLNKTLEFVVLEREDDE